LLFFNQALFPLYNQTLYPVLLNVFPELKMASTGLHTITVSHIAFDIPFVYVIVRARLADFDRTLEEAAADLGANEWKTFQRITLPLLMPGIIGGALMAFTLSLDDYLITAFTKGVREQTMPLYIYSLVRRGVTPEINALSTALLIGSIGLVGLSLTAQSGGAIYTRAMSLGAGLGLGLYGLLSLPALFAAFTLGSLLINLIFLAGLYWAWRSFPAFKEELNEANRSGKILAWFAALIVLVAVYLSTFLLLS
jgi:ABC-type Fe3+ transport system permease subunit